MKDDTFIKISNKDVYLKLKDIEETLQDVLVHAKVTNGRVSGLENKSVGYWIAKHPLRFSIAVLIFFTLVISDVRHPVISFIGSLFL